MSKKDETLQVSRNRAVKIFEVLGFKTAGKWDVSRLQKKIAKLDTLIEGAELDGKTQKRVDEILRVQNNDGQVIVVDPDDAQASKRRSKEVDDAQKREKVRKVEKKAKAEKNTKKEKETVSKKDKKVKPGKKERKVKRAVVIASLLKKNRSIEVDSLYKDADALLEKVGTGANIRETTYQAKIVLDALVEIGYITVENEKIKRV